MQIEDVETLLKTLPCNPSEIDVAVVTDTLIRCFEILRRETGFQKVIPGEPLPMMSWELVKAKESIETAIKMLQNGEVPAALERIRLALSQVRLGMSIK